MQEVTNPDDWDYSTFLDIFQNAKTHPTQHAQEVASSGHYLYLHECKPDSAIQQAMPVALMIVVQAMKK